LRRLLTAARAKRGLERMAEVKHAAVESDGAISIVARDTC
jgi:uncharacterized membrane protein YcaP (DUF421 family)